MITVSVGMEDFRVQFGETIQQVGRPRALLAAVGRTAAKRLRAHFFEKNNTEPNKLGGKRSEFWKRVAESVHDAIVDDGSNTVSVSINHTAIAQKVFGGPIVAKAASRWNIC